MKDIKIKGEVGILAAIVVTIAFLLHLYRVVTSNAITIGTWVLPVWMSIVVIILTIICAIFLWKAILGK